MINLPTPAVMLTIWVLDITAMLLLISVQTVVAGDPATMMGLPNCNTTCGNVIVPYPFGMGPARCYHSPGFKLTCDHGSTKVPRLLLGDGAGAAKFVVVHISLENTTMRVVSQGLHSINTSEYWSLGETETISGAPYFLEPGSNEFILTGCDVSATLVVNGSAVSGCASFCPSDGAGAGADVTEYWRAPNSNTCSHIGCCQSSIITGSAIYGVEQKRFNESLPQRSTTLLLIAEVGWINQNLELIMNVTHGLSPRLADQLRVPVTLHWTIAHAAALEEVCPRDAARSICKSSNSKCSDESSSSSSSLYRALGGYSCQCKEGYQGNPYLTGGCQDIKECDGKEKYGCFGECEELLGSFQCRCPQGTHGNSSIPGGCVKVTNAAGHRWGLIIGLSVVSGPSILLLVLGSLIIIRHLKRRKEKALRRMFFSQNRGQLLKQLVSHRTDIAERMIISLEELENATNNFDQSRRLGGGGHGTVYKGILSDLHVVAIKKSKIDHKNIEREISEFINEVAMLSQINHKNIVKLHGCCLETEVPLLAYEFISNGTLSDHLHMEAPISLPWKDRLRISREISKALAYLHSAISIPIIHRDIKPSNILLDDALTAKVSDFGASRYIPQQTGTPTAVQGTMGYLDPMYYYTRRLTESSDVYSFGVLLVELLTRKRPYLCLSSQGDSIVTRFIELLEDDSLAEILDPQVVQEGGSEVEEVAILAVSCVKLVAGERPTMRQVEMALEALQAPQECVLGDSIPKSSNYLPTITRANPNNNSRCYSLEEEFMLSARHPR